MAMVALDTLPMCLSKQCVHFAMPLTQYTSITCAYRVLHNVGPYLTTTRNALCATVDIRHLGLQILNSDNKRSHVIHFHRHHQQVLCGYRKHHFFSFKHNGCHHNITNEVYDSFKYMLLIVCCLEVDTRKQSTGCYDIHDSIELFLSGTEDGQQAYLRLKLLDVLTTNYSMCDRLSKEIQDEMFICADTWSIITKSSTKECHVPKLSSSRIGDVVINPLVSQSNTTQNFPRLIKTSGARKRFLIQNKRELTLYDGSTQYFLWITIPPTCVKLQSFSNVIGHLLLSRVHTDLAKLPCTRFKSLQDDMLSYDLIQSNTLITYLKHVQHQITRSSHLKDLIRSTGIDHLHNVFVWDDKFLLAKIKICGLFILKLIQEYCLSHTWYGSRLLDMSKAVQCISLACSNVATDIFHLANNGMLCFMIWDLYQCAYRLNNVATVKCMEVENFRGLLPTLFHSNSTICSVIDRCGLFKNLPIKLIKILKPGSSCPLCGRSITTNTYMSTLLDHNTSTITLFNHGDKLVVVLGSCFCDQIIFSDVWAMYDSYMPLEIRYSLNAFILDYLNMGALCSKHNCYTSIFFGSFISKRLRYEYFDVMKNSVSLGQLHRTMALSQFQATFPMLIDPKQDCF